MKGDAITLGAGAAKFAMLEVACRRCERRGRLRIDRLIKQHGADIGLPALCDVLRGDCPKAEGAAVGERCSIFYPQLLRLWEQRARDAPA
jgi:hypothetical protein